jgi:hypothetical protein
MYCADCDEEGVHENQQDCIENLKKKLVLAEAVVEAARKVVAVMESLDKKAEKLVIELGEAIRNYPI